jgi:SAM-dependent methyltransferase
MTASEDTPGLASADWAGEISPRWVTHAGRLEAMLAPVDHILPPAAALSAGAVTGLDISPTLIAEAKTIPPSPSSAPIDWMTADATVHPLSPDAFDAVVSQFGIMFFDDPVAAFTNLRSGVRSNGRLVAAVWQRQDASEFQCLSVRVATRVAADQGVVLRPNPLCVGGPGATPEQDVGMGRQVGPFGMLLRDVPTAVADTIAAALVEEMHTRWDGAGVALSAAIATVTARRP